MSTFNEVRRPKARKEYCCEWCGEPIDKDTLHVQFVGEWEGEFQNWRMHNECYQDAADNDALLEGFWPHSNERPAKPCPRCGGDGKELVHDQTGTHTPYEPPCKSCGGTGKK